MNRKCFRDLYVINITDLTHQHKMIILVVAMPPIVTFSMCIIMDRSWRLDIPHFINSTLVAAYCDHQIRAFEECSCEFMRSHRRCLHQSSCFLHHGLYVSLNNAAWMLTAGSRQTCWYQQMISLMHFLGSVSCSGVQISQQTASSSMVSFHFRSSATSVQRSSAAVSLGIHMIKTSPKDRIRYVLDDRDQVVDMRRKNGLTCF